MKRYLYRCPECGYETVLHAKAEWVTCLPEKHGQDQERWKDLPVMKLVSVNGSEVKP